MFLKVSSWVAPFWWLPVNNLSSCNPLCLCAYAGWCQFWWLPVTPSPSAPGAGWLPLCLAVATEAVHHRCTAGKNHCRTEAGANLQARPSRHSSWLGWRWRQLRQRSSATTWSTTGVASAEASQQQDESRMLQLGARPSCCKERAIASGGGMAERTGAPSAPPSAPWPVPVVYYWYVPGLGCLRPGSGPRRQAAWLFLAERCHHCQRRCS